MSGKHKLVSVRQLEILIEYMRSHPELACGRGKIRSKEGRASANDMWCGLAKILNAKNPSSYRTPREWNKYFNDYKRRVRAKVSQGSTGNPQDTVLTPLEEQLIQIIGVDKGPPPSNDPLVMQSIKVEFNPSDREDTPSSSPSLDREPVNRKRKLERNEELIALERSRIELMREEILIARQRNHLEKQQLVVLRNISESLQTLAKTKE